MMRTERANQFGPAGFPVGGLIMSISNAGSNYVAGIAASLRLDARVPTAPQRPLPDAEIAGGDISYRPPRVIVQFALGPSTSER